MVVLQGALPALQLFISMPKSKRKSSRCIVVRRDHYLEFYYNEMLSNMITPYRGTACSSAKFQGITLAPRELVDGVLV